MPSVLCITREHIISVPCIPSTQIWLWSLFPVCPKHSCCCCHAILGCPISLDLGNTISIPTFGKTWPLWNKVKLLQFKIVQENASLKNNRYWTDGLSRTITRPMESHQYWTVPRQTQRMTTPSFILNRLTPQAEKIITEEQAGSTTEQIFNLQILCEKYLQHQQDLYHVFIDFKKAFGRVGMQLCNCRQPWSSTTSAPTLSKTGKTFMTRPLVPSSSTTA